MTSQHVLGRILSGTSFGAASAVDFFEVDFPEALPSTAEAAPNEVPDNILPT